MRSSASTLSGTGQACRPSSRSSSACAYVSITGFVRRDRRNRPELDSATRDKRDRLSRKLLPRSCQHDTACAPASCLCAHRAAPGASAGAAAGGLGRAVGSRSHSRARLSLSCAHRAAPGATAGAGAGGVCRTIDATTAWLCTEVQSSVRTPASDTAPSVLATCVIS